MKRSQSFTSKSQKPDIKRAQTPQPKQVSDKEKLKINLGQMNTFSTAFTETNDSANSVRINVSSYPQLVQAISKIKLAHLEELRKLKKPNEGTKITATCTLGLFDESTSGWMGPLQSWKNTIRRLKEPEKVLIQIKSIFKTIMSGKIGLATITEITERMKKVRPADLGEITTDFYNWINCVINYYHALDLHAAEQTPQKAARPNTSRTRTTARKYKSPHPSQVGQYIRASTTSRESQRASLDNIMRSYDNPYVRNWVALEMDSKELANLKSVERRKVWDEKRELRKTNSEKQLKTERDDITFRNKERKRMINIEAKAITEEQKTRREYIDQRKQDYDEIRKVKEDSNRKSMMCILQRGKERSKLAQKETTGQIKTSRMKEICLSEFLRPDDVNEVKAQEQRNQEVVVGKRRRQILAERNDIKKIIDKYN